MELYLLNTNVASYILNGELWQRQPAMLMAHRQDIYAAWHLADESLADTIKHHKELHMSVTAYASFQERVRNGGPPLCLSPKVQVEFALISQVSMHSKYFCSCMIARLRTFCTYTLFCYNSHNLLYFIQYLVLIGSTPARWGWKTYVVKASDFQVVASQLVHKLQIPPEENQFFS